MTAKYRVGITRDILDSRGEPAFGKKALEILDAAPGIEWEYLPEVVSEITPQHAARYDAIYVNMARTPAAAVAGADSKLRVVARHGVGYDSVDVPAMTKAGVETLEPLRSAQLPWASKPKTKAEDCQR
jgi:D-3-phosphoglycerate dehydrogenase